MEIEGFKQKIKEDAFLEWEEVYHNQYYGTLKSEIDRIWEKGKTVIFDVDVIGGLNIKKQFPSECLSIFIMPPSKEALLSRLQGRAQDSQEVIEKRMADAEDEMSHFYQFDFLVFNDEFSTALSDIKHIIFSARLTLKEQSYKYNNLLKQLI